MLVKHIFIQRAPLFSLAIAYRLLVKSANHLAGLPSRDNWEEVTVAHVRTASRSTGGHAVS